MQALKARREAHKHNHPGLRRTASATAVPAVPDSGTQTPVFDVPVVGNGSIIVRDHLSPQSTRLPFTSHANSFANGKAVDSQKEDARSVSSSASSDSIILPNPWARFRYHTREFWAEFLYAISAIGPWADRAAAQCS